MEMKQAQALFPANTDLCVSSFILFILVYPLRNRFEGVFALICVLLRLEPQ